jgi:hypothetical protein
LTCISSWYICIPNIIWIHPTITEKMNGNCHYQECDGWTDVFKVLIIWPFMKKKITITRGFCVKIWYPIIPSNTDSTNLQIETITVLLNQNKNEAPSQR